MSLEGRLQKSQAKLDKIGVPGPTPEKFSAAPSKLAFIFWLIRTILKAVKR